MKEEMNYLTPNSVNTLFRRLPPATIRRISRNVLQESRKSGLSYTDDRNKTTLITLTLRPRLIDVHKRNLLQRTLHALDQAFYKIGRLYSELPSLYEIFPFAAAEHRWILMMHEPGYKPGRLVSRWDANTTFGFQDWKDGYSFFEVNGVGVGGLWYGPACADVTMKVIVPELQKLDPKFRPHPNHDIRLLLLNLLLAQRKKLGRTRGAIALFMEKSSGSNFVEFERLARMFSKLGHPTIVTEPTDFRLKGNEIYARGKKIDILYRDTTLSELCLLEEKGHDLSALRLGFRRGQIVSSLEGEFDHKSVFEVFTSPEYAKYFTAKENRLFRNHILWTRLLREINTTDSKGKKIDLIPYTIRIQSRLVLKPNRLYGGKGIVFGKTVTRSAWERKIESALREPGDWVIQSLGEVRKKRFFRSSENKASEKNLYVVSGFFATAHGLGIVGRMSEAAIVNVAQRGGLTPILLI